MICSASISCSRNALSAAGAHQAIPQPALICRGTGIRRPGAVFAFAAASIFIAMVVVGNANTTFIVFSLGMLSSFPSFRFPTHYMMLVLSTIRA